MTNLRAVSDTDRDAVKPRSILEAAQLSERSLLVGLRDKLATDLDTGVPAHALRGIAAELRDIDRAIRLMDAAAAEEGSVIAGTDDDTWNQSAI